MILRPTARNGTAVGKKGELNTMRMGRKPIKNRITHFFFSFRIQMEVKISSREDLSELELSETRILLLYSTRQEGSNIMRWAKKAGLTGQSYVWIATQSVIGENKDALEDFPAGMLGMQTNLKE